LKTDCKVAVVGNQTNITTESLTHTQTKTDYNCSALTRAPSMNKHVAACNNFWNRLHC